MALGKNVKTNREARGWDQKTLSRLSGVDVGTISAMEVRNSKRSDKAADLARAFGMTLEQLLSDPHTINVEAVDVTHRMAIAAHPATVSEFDTDTVHIPYYDTGGAMGHGIVMRDQPGVIREMSVSKEWLQSNVRGYTNAENLCLVTGFGDSMRPLFMSGDPVIVDKGVTEFRGDGLYFFRVEGEGFIKRLQSIPGRGLVVISENPSYESWNIDKATTDFQVLGKVIKAWCGCDF